MIYSVNNVTDLISQPASVNDVCILTDQYRGGYFVCMSGTPANDNGTIVSCSTPGKYWKRIFQGDYQVTWFGAVPDATGDAGTDATSAINYALLSDTVYPSGDIYTALKRKVRLNNGHYTASGAIFVRKGQHLQGEGWGNTMFNARAAGVNIYLGGGNPGGIVTDDDNSYNTVPELSDFLVVGYASNTSVIYCGIQGAYIHNMWLLSNWDAIDLINTATNVNIHSCMFDQSSNYSIKFGGSNINVDNCVFWYTVHGVYIRGKGTSDHSIVYEATRDVVFNNCRFEFYRPRAFPFDIPDRQAIKIGSSGTSEIANVSITNCIFTFGADQGGPDNSLISLDAYNMANIRISNCLFNNWCGYVIQDTNTTSNPTVKGCYIENCHFRGAPSSGQYTAGTSQKGIRLRSGVYHIYNCTFDSILTGTIDGETQKQITLTGNQQITLYINAASSSLVQNNNTHPGTQVIPV